MTNRFSPKKLEDEEQKLPPSNLVGILQTMAEEGGLIKDTPTFATPIEIQKVVDKIRKETGDSWSDIFKQAGYPDKRQLQRFMKNGKFPFTALLALKYLHYETTHKEGFITISDEQVREIINVLAFHHNKLVNVMTQFFDKK